MKKILTILFSLFTFSLFGQNQKVIAKFFGMSFTSGTVVADWNGSTGTNQATNLSNAITAAPDNSTIYIPNGNYYLSTTITLTSRKNLTIIGSDSTVFYSTSGHTVFDVITCTNVDFVNLSVHSSSGSPTSNDFFRITGGTDCDLTKIRAYGFRLAYYTASGSNYHDHAEIIDCRGQDANNDAITLHNVRNIQIERCTLYNQSQDGLKLNSDSRNVIVRNCYFSSNADDGIDCYGGGRDLDIENCEFVSQTNQIKNYGSTGINTKIQNIQIHRCRFEDSNITILSNYSPLLALTSSQTGNGSDTTFTVTHNLGYSSAFFTAYTFQSGSDLVVARINAVDANSFTVDISTPPASGTFYIVYYYKVYTDDAITIQSIPSGTDTITIAHTFASTDLIDLQFRLASTLAVSSPAYSITYGTSSVFIDFDTPLAADVKLYMRERQTGIRGLHFYDNDVRISAGTWVSTNGGAQLILENNFIVGSTTNILNFRPLLTGSRISNNTFIDNTPGSNSTASSLFVAFSTPSDATYGVHQQDAVVEIKNNTVERANRWINNNANSIFNPYLIGNRAIDLTEAISLSGLTCASNTQYQKDNVWIAGSVVTKPAYVSNWGDIPQVWTTGTRPTPSATEYRIGFNTTNSGLEFWNGSAWVSLTTSN